jgi:hypothetical protein
VPEKFREHVRAGFGLWLDNDSGKIGNFYPTETAKNYFSPQEWQTSVELALKHTDKYVWIYNERALWWDPSKRPGKDYEQATLNAREAVIGAAAGK